jgi:hypothetical protein
MKRLIGFTVVCALLMSCATTGTPGGSRAKKKAGVGAFLGGLAGAATAILQGKGDDEVLAAAAAGAVAGAVAGYAIGRAQDRRLAGRDDAVKRYAYDPRRGPLLTLEAVELSPTTIPPGSTAQIKMVYTVLSPGEYDTIPVAYASSLFQGGEQILDLGQQSTTVSDGGGTIEVTMPFIVPPEAPGGTYELRADIALTGSQLSDSATQSFYIGS